MTHNISNNKKPVSVKFTIYFLIDLIISFFLYSFGLLMLAMSTDSFGMNPAQHNSETIATLLIFAFMIVPVIAKVTTLVLAVMGKITRGIYFFIPAFSIIVLLVIYIGFMFILFKAQ